MCEFKHTPGPWHWVNRFTDKPYDFDAIDTSLVESYRHKVAPNVSLRTVAEFTKHNMSLPEFICEAEEITRGNANLIAAAPEMFEALKEAVECLADLGLQCPNQRSALIKAEGKSCK